MDVLLHYAYVVSPWNRMIMLLLKMPSMATAILRPLELAKALSSIFVSMSLPRSASGRRDKRTMLLKWLLVAPARRWAFLYLFGFFRA